MKILKLLFAILLLASSARAGHSDLYIKLLNINAQWQYHTDALPSDVNLQNFTSDADWISLHLLAVYENLSKVDVSGLSKTQLKNRQQSLTELKDYALRKRFPKNITHPGRRPVFIDHQGTHCAVGYLIMKSGHAELSNHISESMNYSYLKDMEGEALTAWVAQSGFTVDELAWIQPAYFNPINYKPLKGGTSGRVNAIISDNNAGLFVAGHFDSAGAVVAGSIANYFSGFAGFDWMRVGDTGTVGEIHDMIYYKNELYVAGNFWQIDSTVSNSGVVKWDGNDWQVVGDFYIGALVNYVLDLEIYHDTLYAGGFFRAKASSPKYFESVAKWNGTDWEHAGVDLTGTVQSLHVHNNKLVIGGQFFLNDSANTRNICMLNGNQLELFDEDISLAVNDMETFKGELFVGTDFSHSGEQDTLGLLVYRNNDWQVIYNGGYQFTPNEDGVKALAAYQDVLFFGGDFIIQPVLGNYGENMAFYRNNYVSAFGTLDSTVHTLKVINDELFLGGDFEFNKLSGVKAPVNHICKVYLPDYVSLKESVKLNAQLYPNPASERVFVAKQNNAYGINFTLVDMQGRTHPVSVMDMGNKWQLDVSTLSAGTYIIKSENGIGEGQKIIIE